MIVFLRCDPCEWIVQRLVEGSSGVERTAAALKVGLQPLLVGAADILLAKNCFPQALPLYKLAKVMIITIYVLSLSNCYEALNRYGIALQYFYILQFC